MSHIRHFARYKGYKIGGKQSSLTQLRLHACKAWHPISLIPGLRRQKGHPGLYGEFQDSQGYKVRPCLKNKQINRQTNQVQPAGNSKVHKYFYIEEAVGRYQRYYEQTKNLKKEQPEETRPQMERGVYTLTLRMERDVHTLTLRAADAIFIFVLFCSVLRQGLTMLSLAGLELTT